MGYLDAHPQVVQWASEELAIPYVSPIDGRVHRYFPDFIVKQHNKLGEMETVIIEVKPFIQTKPPTVQTTKAKKPTKRYITEVKTWGVNTAKWQAAKRYCEDRKWKFIIMTEYELGIKN
jgi:hypothetical protein